MPDHPPIHIERGKQFPCVEHFLARARLNTTPRLPVAGGPTFTLEDYQRDVAEIGTHPICQLFNQPIIDAGSETTLREALIEVITPMDCFVGVHVLRVGFVNAPREGYHPTIFLQLLRDTTEVEEAVEMVRRAAEILYRFPELRDVSIEICEANCGRFY